MLTTDNNALSGKTVLRIINNQLEETDVAFFINNYRTEINMDDFLIEAKKQDWTLQMLYTLCKSKEDVFYNNELLLKLGILFNCY